MYVFHITKLFFVIKTLKKAEKCFFKSEFILPLSSIKLLY